MERDLKFQTSYQGTLDYFCGIYAVINAIGVASSKFKVLTYTEKCDFFRYFLLRLQKERILDRVIRRGSSCDLEEEYLVWAQKYMRKKHKVLVQWRKISSFKKWAHLNFENVLSLLAYWTKEEGHACVVRVKNKKMGDHWTVFKKVKFPICYLSDSYRFLKLKFKKKDKKQDTQMMKKGIFLIRAKKMS